jgi:hypothetical protein
MERAQRALSKRYNLLNVTRRSLSYETRLAKYSRRGYAVAVPELDAARVNEDAFKLPDIKSLQGALRLLALDYVQRMQQRPAPDVGEGVYCFASHAA